MLEVAEVSKHFKGSGFSLNKISFSLGKGIYVLIGPNGAGKSTLLRIVATVLRPDAGDIVFNGRSVYLDLSDYKRTLGYLPQTVGFYEHMTGREFLRYIARLKGLSLRGGLDRVDYVIELAGIRRECCRKIGALSVGLRQRLGLAQALVGDPGLLVLDEPFCGLDAAEAAEVGRLLAQIAKDRTVLVSSHVFVNLPLAKLLFLLDGRLRFFGLPTVFLDEAKGRVWSVDTTKHEWLKVQHNYPASTFAFAGDRCRGVVISEDRPGLPGAAAINPGLEEAYLYWLRRFGQPGKDKPC